MSHPQRITATRAPGFTLIEILVVLAIIALLAGLVIGGTTSLLAPKTPSPEEVFWKAVQAARKSALEATHEIQLRFDSKEQALIVDDGVAPRAFPIAAIAGGDATVDFFSTQKGAGTSGFGGVNDTQPLRGGVTFYDDGTCTPFRVQIRTNGGTQILAIDPWTCAAVLPAKP